MAENGGIKYQKQELSQDFYIAIKTTLQTPISHALVCAERDLKIVYRLE